jgi:hypothetical protein
MKRRIPIFSIFTTLILDSILFATIIHVGAGYNYNNLQPAANVAQPGDTIFFHAGIYSGNQYITLLNGMNSAWIYILTVPGETVIIQGGSNAWHLVDPSYVKISGFIFEQQTSNGVNIDDGGNYVTPAHDIIIEGCIFRDMNASGNNDLLKMSGVDYFEINGCQFLNGSAGGSGIDMVGCHNGIIQSTYFENQGSNSIQAKGGSQYVTIMQNLFVDGGQRSVNLGGSTGLAYFRPDTASFEAADLQVYSNIFIGSVAPIAYVGCTDVRVVNNTIFKPERWVVRILQETTDPRFVQSSYNFFRNNIIYYGDISTETNIGPNTQPLTFNYANNLWYKYTNPQTTPNIPVTDSTMLIGQDPLFVDTLNRDFNLLPASPAIGQISTIEEPKYDYLSRFFNNPRSMGAIEGNPISTILEDQLYDPADNLTSDPYVISAYPNPFNPSTKLIIHIPVRDNFVELSIFNVLGKQVRIIYDGKLQIGEHTFFWDGNSDRGIQVAAGIYFAILQSSQSYQVKKLIFTK